VKRVAVLTFIFLLLSTQVCYAYVYNDAYWSAGYADFYFGDTLPLSMQIPVRYGAVTWNDAPSSFYFALNNASHNQWWYGSIDGKYGTLAYAWYDAVFGLIYDADTKFDSGETWNTNVTRAPYLTEVDAWSVAAHEFGHWLSLGHSTSSPDGYKPTMYPYINYGEYFPRDLAQDDKNGIWYIYEVLH